MANLATRLGCVLFLSLTFPMPVSGQEELVWDRVELRDSAGEGRRTLSGMVRDVQSSGVEIELPSGGRRRIAREEILSVQLLRQPELVAAEASAGKGEFERARQEFEAVLSADVPRWLKRHAAARRLQCLRALQQYRLAVADFGTLAQDDLTQVPWEAAPIVWTGVSVDALMQEQIEQWLQSPRVWEQLAAASLGLQHPPTAAASQRVLEGLVRAAAGESGGPVAGAGVVGSPANLEAGAAPRVADVQRAAGWLAEAQLWRIPRGYSVEQLQVLQARADAGPVELGAGPQCLLGRLWKNAGQANRAIDASLQVATRYPEQHDLVLLGLETAYTTLRGVDPAEASRVGQWLVQLQPNSGQADEIRRELGLNGR